MTFGARRRDAVPMRRAIKSGALARGFETTIPPEVLRQLEQQMEATDDA